MSILNSPNCGVLYLYACDGHDVAYCPFEEGGGYTLLFDKTSHALVAAAEYPPLHPGEPASCYVGPLDLESLVQAGPPNCPMGPLLGVPGVDAGD